VASATSRVLTSRERDAFVVFSAAPFFPPPPPPLSLFLFLSIAYRSLAVVARSRGGDGVLDRSSGPAILEEDSALDAAENRAEPPDAERGSERERKKKEREREREREEGERREKPGVAHAGFLALRSRSRVSCGSMPRQKFFEPRTTCPRRTRPEPRNGTGALPLLPRPQRDFT